MIFKKPKAVIFDWDNTIVVSHQLFFKALHHALDTLDMEHSVVDLPVFKENAQLSLKDGFPKIFGARCDEVSAAYRAYVKDVHLDYVTLVPYVHEALQHLAQCGVVLSVVSNKDGDFVRREAQKLGVSRYFHAVVGSMDTEEDKPSVMPVHFSLKGKFAASDFGDDIWFVGDSVVDMKCGHNALCTTILFGGCSSCLSGTTTEMAAHIDCLPHHKITSHNELLELFKKSCMS